MLFFVLSASPSPFSFWGKNFTRENMAKYRDAVYWLSKRGDRSHSDKAGKHTHQLAHLYLTLYDSWIHNVQNSHKIVERIYIHLSRLILLDLKYFFIWPQGHIS